jgi:hypothetical protein
MGELLEEMEHAAHAGHDDHGHGGGHGDAGGKKSIGKFVGLTMAILGVLMAVCSALVGMSRTELIATMVEKSETGNISQTVNAKYRLMESQLQSTHAFLQTDPEGAKKKAQDIDDVVKQHSGNLDVVAAMQVTRMETAILMDAVIPSTDDVVDMAKQTKRYMIEREAAAKWAESYEDKVGAIEESGEHFEWAQLAAEIGVVLASIALLLQSRLAWMGSITLGVASIGLIVFTFATSKAKITKAQGEIAEAHEAYEKTSNDKVDEKKEEKLIEETIKMASNPNYTGEDKAPNTASK